ncbi:hypothetical protein CYMTET_8542 [Cymbomonas tetramitiformis]|uniref:DDE-1 domain-containing protein n=1 Tax=Cymbomonas tetramitiformis TaxID=36881 RepID=A0AAE0GT45_9CHLO|nr:hypothetical protein CYMTET_8542 [Cymbomonas tetramitiformis]
MFPGHGSHLSCQLLTYCREVGIIIVLRPPHTTNISQGEDVINFGTFKPLFRTVKANRLLEKLNTGSKKLFLDMGDLMPCTTAAWEEAFSKEENRKAWAKIGANPFTRCVYCELRGKEEVANARVKKVEGVNLEVLTFGFKGKEPMSKAGEEEEEEGEGRERGRAVLERSAKYAKLAEAAQQKLAQTGHDVKQAKLLKEEMVGVLRGMGETPASNARKEVLEGALQELLGQPTTVPAATTEEEAATPGTIAVEPTTIAMPAATSAAK